MEGSEVENEDEEARKALLAEAEDDAEVEPSGDDSDDDIGMTLSLDHFIYGTND